MPIGELDIAAGINGQLSGHLRHAEGQVAAAEEGNLLREGHAKRRAGERQRLGVDELGLIHHSLFNLQLGLIGTGKAGRFHADGYGGTGGDLLAIPAEKGDRRARGEAAFFFLFNQLAVIVINLIAQIHPAGDLGFAQVIEQNIKVVR